MALEEIFCRGWICARASARGEIRYIRGSRCLSGNDADAVYFSRFPSRSREGEAWDIMQLGYDGINSLSPSLLAEIAPTSARRDGRTDRFAIVQYWTINNSTFGSQLSYCLCCYRSLRKRRQRNRDTITLRLISLTESAKFYRVFRAPILLFGSFVNRPNKWTLGWSTRLNLESRIKLLELPGCFFERLFNAGDSWNCSDVRKIIGFHI